MQLYKYQQRAIEQLKPSTIMHWDLGTGKTVSSLAHWERQATGRPLLVVAPASKIRTGDWQSESLAWFGDNIPDITYISYERLRLMDKDTRRPRWWQFCASRNGGIKYDVIADECLTGETLITVNNGNKKQIADIKIGDMVQSFNHETLKIENKQVVNVRKRKSDGYLYCVFTSNGVIISTYNHKHYVNNDYMMTKDIKIGDVLYEQRQDDDTRGGKKASSDQNAYTSEEIRKLKDVSSVRQNGDGSRNGYQASTTISSEKSELVLFSKLWASLQQKLYERIRQETGKYNQQSRVSVESKSNTQEKRHTFANMDKRQDKKTSQGRQRQNINTSTDAIRQAADGVGIRAAYKDIRAEWVRLSNFLQSGHRQPVINDSNRGRWGISQFESSRVQRQEERRQVTPVRVESIKVVKQSDITKLGFVREPDYVYCLEVADNHNYFANGILTHNCHAIKNPQSKQSQAVNEIVKSGGVFIGLSGTPMANGWIDFAGYSKLFGFTKGITEYKTKYVRYRDFKGFPEIIGYNNIPELERQWAVISRYLSRADALELPDRQMIGQTLKLTPKSLKLYQTIKLTRVHPKTGEIYDNAPKLLNALRQATIEPRLDALESILSDTSDNVVVFYNYISEREAILKLLEKMGGKKVIRYDGEVHDELPASDAKLTNTVMLAHYKSGSTGLNLQWANTTVYFSPTYSYQEFEQSVGRTHRTGQTRKCLYYLFRVSGTVDVNIWQCLKNKQSFTNELISKYLEEDV